MHRLEHPEKEKRIEDAIKWGYITRTIEEGIVKYTLTQRGAIKWQMERMGFRE